MQKKHISETEVSFVIPGAAETVCGYLPNDKIYEYIEKLKRTERPIIQCAAYTFAFNIYPYKNSQNLWIKANPHNIKPLCQAITYAGCIRNLRRGKCRDPFMIKNVGKVFFADKYKDDNQR